MRGAPVLRLTSFFAAVAVVASSGCNIGAAIDPCKAEHKWDDFNAQTWDERLDGTWTLETINGVSLPFGVPLIVDEKAYSGSLKFSTDTWWGDTDCKHLASSVGSVIGTYDVHLPGQPSALESATGRFDANHNTKTVTFALGPKSLPATLSVTNGVKRITASIKIKKLGGLTFTGVFKKTGAAP